LNDGVAKTQIENLPNLLTKLRRGPKPKLSDNEKYQIVNDRYKGENASLTLNQYLDKLSSNSTDLEMMIDENQFYEMRTYLIENKLMTEENP
jgi:predicted S18 family serine protease